MQLTLAPCAPSTAQGAALRRSAARQQRRAAPLAVRASGSSSAGSQTGLFTTNSSLLGPKLNSAPGGSSPSLGAPLSSSKAAGPSLDDVQLKSGVRRAAAGVAGDAVGRMLCSLRHAWGHCCPKPGAAAARCGACRCNREPPSRAIALPRMAVPRRPGGRDISAPGPLLRHQCTPLCCDPCSLQCLLLSFHFLALPNQ